MGLDWLDDEGDTERPVLTVVLPSYRAADLLATHVPVLLRYLDTLGIATEVLIADDGSDDRGATQRVAESLGCRYLSHPVNRGKGATVRMGMLAARGRYRLFTDADIPFELEVIEQALYYLAFKEFHVVAGDRTLEESHYYVGVEPLRRLGSQVYAGITGRLVTGGWYDTQCGFKAFRAEVAEELFSVSRIDRFAGDVEILYLALKRNYDIKRLPVRLRSQGGSSVRVVRDGLEMVWDLLRIRYHQLRGHYDGGHDATPGGGQDEAERRLGDAIAIAGDYQYKALHEGPAPQRFWHKAKLDGAFEALEPSPGDVILDVGCGSGTLTDRLAAVEGTRVIGVDGNAEAIAFARAAFRRPNLEYHEGLVDELALADESVDKIAFLEVIEHLPKEQARAVLAGFRRVLKPGGRLVISTPNERSPWPVLEWLLDRVGPTAHMAEDQHVAAYRPSTLKALASDLGFNPVEARTLMLAAPWLSWLDWSLAEQAANLEARHDLGFGCLLLQTFEKPDHPDRKTS